MMPWANIKLVALALLLTVLAHDAVMAGDPHAAGHNAERHHAGASVHESLPAPALHRAEQASTYLLLAGETPCDPTIAARPSSAADLLPDRAAEALIQPGAADASLPLAPVSGEEPTHPPNVRRALLQVFLN